MDRTLLKLGLVCMLRRVFLVLVAVSAWLIANEATDPPDVQPLPGPGLTVQIPLKLSAAGDYILRVLMPKVGNALGLSPETVPCDISLRVVRNGAVVVLQNATSMTRLGELGHWRVQEYQAGDSFHLQSGEYDAVVSGSSNCTVAATRGASMEIAEVYRERILAGLARYYGPRILMIVSLLVLVLLEFMTKPNNRIERTRDK